MIVNLLFLLSLPLVIFRKEYCIFTKEKCVFQPDSLSHPSLLGPILTLLFTPALWVPSPRTPMEEGASRPGLPRMWVRHIGQRPATSVPSCSVLGEWGGEKSLHRVPFLGSSSPGSNSWPGRCVCVLVMRWEWTFPPASSSAGSPWRVSALRLSCTLSHCKVLIGFMRTRSSFLTGPLICNLLSSQSSLMSGSLKALFPPRIWTNWEIKAEVT